MLARRGVYARVANTVPRALEIVGARGGQPEILILAPSPVFLWPDWRCPIDAPTRVHATFEMYDAEVAQFMGRFNHYFGCHVIRDAAVGQVKRVDAAVGA